MIYLDNAATSFPKPQPMVKEIVKCINKYCGNPGRSGHVLSLKAAEKIYSCRETIASFFNSEHPENVVFTYNTTYALNIAINAFFTEGSHILISNMEHNSVLRPIYHLCQNSGAEYSVFNVLQGEQDILEELESKIRYNTRMLIMTHASNICGKIFPVRTIGNFCRQRGIIFIVDAAQSAGVCPIDTNGWYIDALCAPAHKGLYGPQGLGFVLFGKKLPHRHLITGGNGSNSLSAEMGNDLPEAYEAGTVATPLIAGLEASINWLNRIGINNINNHERALAQKLYERLKSIDGYILYGPKIAETGIILAANQKHSIERIYYELNRNNICTRSGFHCSPLAHRTLNTSQSGAIRFSFGYFNTVKEVDAVYSTLKNIM